MSAYKILFAASLALAAGSLVYPAQAQPPVEDILGPWDMTVNAMNQEIKMRLMLREENGELSGSVETPQGTQAAENVTYTDGELKWVIKFGPQPLELSVTVEGETMHGTATTPFGDIVMNGVKVSDEAILAELAKYEALVGDWTVYNEYNGDDIESGLRFQIVNNEIRGTIEMPGLDARVGRINLDGDKLSWMVALPFISDQPARGNVTLGEVGTFAGTLTTTLGNIEIRGEKIDTTKLSISPYDDPARILGDWQVSADVDGTVSEATAKIFEQDDRLAATITVDGVEMIAESVEWKEISETMGVIQLRMMNPALSPELLHFELIVDGDTFEGEEVSGVLPYEFIVSGKKL